MHAVGGEALGQEAEALVQHLRPFGGREHPLVPELCHVRAATAQRQALLAGHRLGQRHQRMHLLAQGSGRLVHRGVELDGGLGGLLGEVPSLRALLQGLPQRMARG